MTGGAGGNEAGRAPSAPINPGSQNVLFGVTALTRASAWAAGAYTFGSTNFGTLVESWDGMSWYDGTEVKLAWIGSKAAVPGASATRPGSKFG